MGFLSISCCKWNNTWMNRKYKKLWIVVWIGEIFEGLCKSQWKNEIQHIGCDSNKHDWLLNLLSENSCYTLEWGIIKIENGEMSIYEKQWKHSLDQVNVGIWNDIILCVSIRFDMILQTSLTIILRTVIVYCLVTARIR